MRQLNLKEKNMKKLAVYSALLVTLLAVTACENRNTTNNPPSHPPTKDRPMTPPNPNAPPPADRDQIQR